MAEFLTSGISTFAIIVIIGIALFWLLSIFTDDQRNPSNGAPQHQAHRPYDLRCRCAYRDICPRLTHALARARRILSVGVGAGAASSFNRGGLRFSTRGHHCNVRIRPGEPVFPRVSRHSRRFQNDRVTAGIQPKSLFLAVPRAARKRRRRVGIALSLAGKLGLQGGEAYAVRARP